MILSQNSWEGIPDKVPTGNSECPTSEYKWNTLLNPCVYCVHGQVLSIVRCWVGFLSFVPIYLFIYFGSCSLSLDYCLFNKYCICILLSFVSEFLHITLTLKLFKTGMSFYLLKSILATLWLLKLLKIYSTEEIS